MVSRWMRITGITLLALVILAATGCTQNGPARVVATQAANPSTTQTPTKTGAKSSPVGSSNSVMAEGKVVPVQDASLSFSIAGVVEEVLVKEGDTVQADQPLIRLKGNEQLTAAVAAANLQLLTAQQTLDDLTKNADVARANAQLNLATAQKNLKTAKDRVQSKEFSRGDQEQIDTARANYIIAEDAVKKATELYDKLDNRPADDPVRAEGFSQLAAARQVRDTALANLNYLLDKPTDLDVNEINAKLAVAEANVAAASRQLDLVKDGPDTDKMALAKAQVDNAQETLNAAKAAVDNLVLKAPFAGSMVAINVSKGEAVSPNVPILVMADFSGWKVNTTDLTELNIARVSVGQPAMVRLDALPGADIVGRVESIKNQGENRQGDIVYTVSLKLENPDQRLRWNMTASVTFLEKGANP